MLGRPRNPLFGATLPRVRPEAAMSSTPTLRTIVADLRVLLARLERLTADDGSPLPDRILSVLHDGPLSTAQVRRLVARRQADVLSTLRILADAGRLKRVDGQWSLIDE